MRKNKLCVIIPTYNEEKSIFSVVKEIEKLNIVDACFVLDDGSVDNTYKEALRSGSTVIKISNNIGVGRTIQMGLKIALKKNYDITIILDADGQHDPQYIPLLVSEINSGFDYVIASRYSQKSDNVTTFWRRQGTKIISIFLYFFYKKKIHDPTSGYRAVNKKILQYLTYNYPTTFSEPECIMDLIKNNFKISEIPCQMRKRQFGNSSITTFKALFLISFILSKIVFRKVSMSI